MQIETVDVVRVLLMFDGHFFYILNREMGMCLIYHNFNILKCFLTDCFTEF